MVSVAAALPSMCGDRARAMWASERGRRGRASYGDAGKQGKARWFQLRRRGSESAVVHEEEERSFCFNSTSGEMTRRASDRVDWRTQRRVRTLGLGSVRSVASGACEWRAKTSGIGKSLENYQHSEIGQNSRNLLGKTFAYSERHITRNWKRRDGWRATIVGGLSFCACHRRNQRVLTTHSTHLRI